MAEQFPEAPYCKVRWRIASINGSTTEDASIVFLPKEGTKITLRPSIQGYIVYTDPTNLSKTSIFVENVDAVVDSSGYLVSNKKPISIAPTNDPNMSVTGWTWRAEVGSRIVEFSAPSGGVVELSDFVQAPATSQTKRWVDRLPELIELITGTAPPVVDTSDIYDAVAAYLLDNPTSVDPIEIASVVSDYLANNPVDVDPEEIASSVAEYILANPIAVDAQDIAEAVSAYILNNPVEVDVDPLVIAESVSSYILANPIEVDTQDIYAAVSSYLLANPVEVNQEDVTNLVSSYVDTRFPSSTTSPQNLVSYIEGTLVDSGYKASDFATSSQGEKADSAIQTDDLLSALAGKANTSHSHTISDVTNLEEALDSKRDNGPVSWGEIEDKPSVFGPSEHQHTIADVLSLSDSLAGKVQQSVDGRMVQGGQYVGAVYTLGADEDEADVPLTLPQGTLIVQRVE